MQSEDVMVSIICPTFNHEKYIESCLDGFLMQKTDFSYEVIVHDDCSSDRTAKIIRKYKKENKEKIKAILQTENQYSKGINIVRDIMIPLAKGKYIAYCEGDDAWIDETKLARQVRFLEENLEYIACVHNTLFHRCDKRYRDFPMFIYNEDRDLDFEDVFKWNAFGYQYSSLLVKRELFTDPPFGYGEYPMALYIALTGKIRFLSRNMSVYRFRSGKYATRANVFSRVAMINDTKGYIENLEKIRDYIIDANKKSLVEDRIEASYKGLDSLLNITDEEYEKRLLKQERMLDIKLFVRSHFRALYKIIVCRR